MPYCASTLRMDEDTELIQFTMFMYPISNF